MITSETNAAEVTKLMIGRDIVQEYKKVEKNIGENVLKVENLCKKGQYRDISFEVKKGEIVGLYGLVGAGRTEIAETIFGLRKPDSGKIIINNEEAKNYDAKKAIELGIGYIPEDRKKNGLVLCMNSLQNMSLTVINRVQKFSFVIRNRENNIYREYVPKLSIKVLSPTFPVNKLSGGNQQKIVISKWLAANPQLLILDEPTRGIDVGAKAEIHQLIKEMAKNGVAVLVISSEMPEIMGVSDRIITIWQGKQTAEFNGETVEEIDLINGATNQVNYA
ncbi:MAG: sugar ABC transporter ATP-binding protein [Clostridiaceae bacterium]|nr:sugar ABC transporter ATP-binding protein [Clostridiaceae bacterium]